MYLLKILLILAINHLNTINLEKKKTYWFYVNNHTITKLVCNIDAVVQGRPTRTIGWKIYIKWEGLDVYERGRNLLVAPVRKSHFSSRIPCDLNLIFRVLRNSRSRACSTWLWFILSLTRIHFVRRHTRFLVSSKRGGGATTHDL